MFSGIELAQTDITAAITSFMGIGAVVAVLGAVLALRLLPKAFRVLKGLAR